jgi:hypothetical protein
LSLEISADGEKPGIEARSDAASLFLFLVSAAFLAASFLCEAFAGSERPSMNQSGFGRLNNDNLSETVPAECLDDVDLVAAGFGFGSPLAVEEGFGGIGMFVME